MTLLPLLSQRAQGLLKDGSHRDLNLANVEYFISAVGTEQDTSQDRQAELPSSVFFLSNLCFS